MKFFIDSANLDQIREANELGVLDGVTMAGAYSSYNSLRANASPRLHPSINSCSSINTCYSLIT